MLSDGIKSAILACFRNVAWIDQNGESSYDNLSALFSGQAFSVTYNLVNCSCSNNTIVINSGDDYTATISSISDYALANATVVITMDGVDITDMAYSNGAVNITNVSGNISITATLASGYTLGEYIGISSAPPADGIILTNIALSSSYTINTEIYYIKNGSSPFPLMGTRHGYGAQEFALFITPTTGKLGYWWDGDNSLNENITTMQYNHVNSLSIKPVGKSAAYPNNMTITVNGTEYDSDSSKSGTVFDSWFGLFGYARSVTEGTTIGANIGAKLGETIVFDESDNVIHDLIPATNGTYIGMYDAKTSTFYANKTHNNYYTIGSWSEVN